MLDRSRLGPPCGLDAGTSDHDRLVGCERGECAGFSGDFRCVIGDPCGLLTCPAGEVCHVMESYPVQIACGTR